MNTPNEIIQLAKSWALTWPFVDIDTVTYDYKVGGGRWYGPDKKAKENDPRRVKAKIVVGGGEGLPIIYHEAFHSVCHLSPFQKAAPYWVEGWCNAFCEVMRQDFTAYPKDLKARPRSRHEREYLMACAVICDYVGRDPARLKQLWAAVNRPGVARSFSQLMGYDPKSGLFIDPDRYPPVHTNLITPKP